jgi:hypothetical protein
MAPSRSCENQMSTASLQEECEKQEGACVLIIRLRGSRLAKAPESLVGTLGRRGGRDFLVKRQASILPPII